MASSMIPSATACLTMGFASMLMAGCDSTAPEPACRTVEGQLTQIGENGGTISLDGDGVVLVVPPGAVTGACGVAVSIEPWTDVSAVPWSGGARALFDTWYWIRAHDLSAQPEKVRLALPATLTIRYDPASVPPGESEAELVLAQVTRVGCTEDPFTGGCSWDLAYRSLTTSRVDTAADRLTGALTCLAVCGGRSDGTGDGTGEFLVMHPQCRRLSGDPADPRWLCDLP